MLNTIESRVANYKRIENLYDIIINTGKKYKFDNALDRSNKEAAKVMSYITHKRVTAEEIIAWLDDSFWCRMHNI